MPDDDRNVEIRIDRIPVGRSIGALVAIVVLLGAMLVELPSLRLPAIAGLVGGLVVAIVLILWHRRSR
jgi:hypothetical protein